jgi:6-phosphogluconolactonase
MRPEIHVDHASGLAGRLARLFEEESERARARRGFCAIALPGGSVAAIFFPELAGAQCDWSRTAFFQADERAVPPDHPDSNYRLARELWLDPAGVPASSVHRMPADDPDLERAALAYEALLARTLGGPPRLDLALLGMGPDGHVCSLFPGHPLLDERVRLVAAIDDAPKPPPRRMTLTLPMLWSAELLVVAALGEAKAEALRDALEDPASALPVAQAVRGARRAVLLLDPPAARRLSRS